MRYQLQTQLHEVFEAGQLYLRKNPTIHGRLECVVVISISKLKIVLPGIERVIITMLDATGDILYFYLPVNNTSPNGHTAEFFNQ